MVTSESSFRINEDSFNKLLSRRFDRNVVAKQRRGGGIYGDCPYISTTFLHEEVQPTALRNNLTYSGYNDADCHSKRECIQAHISIVGPKRRCFPYLVPGFIQHQTVQPPMTSTFGDSSYDNVSHHSEMKIRSRSNYSRTKTSSREEKIELRIEGDTLNDIIEAIRNKTSCTASQESSSIFVKGIRGLLTANIDLRTAKKNQEFVLLLNSFKDLIKNKGSSWKRIRIQECAPWIVEALLTSTSSINYEEIHLVKMCDDEQYPLDHVPSLSTQAEPSSTSSLIISLLRKSTRIKQLVVKDCNLHNLDLDRIMNVLCAHPHHPKSLEHLDLRFNKFTPIAIHSFLAVHLRSSLHALKTVKLRQGLRCDVHRNIRNDIVQSLRCNQVVLESIDIFDWDKLVQYQLDINRAKRRHIFCNNDHFPRSLWPLLLERGLVTNDDNDSDSLTGNTKSASRSSLCISRLRNTCTTRRQASVVYHIFRNGGPMLLQQQHQSGPCIGIESN